MSTTKKLTYLGRAVGGQEKHPECSVGPYTETLAQPNPAIVTLRNYVNCPSHKLWYKSCVETWKEARRNLTFNPDVCCSSNGKDQQEQDENEGL